MRPLLLFVLLASPAFANGDPKPALMAPDPACEAPAIATEAVTQPVTDTNVPPPFRLALFACARVGEGPSKAPVRRT